MAQRGFILLEIMVAVVILAMTLPILLGLRNRDVEIISHARAMSTATALAHVKLVEASIQDFPLVGEQGGDFTAAQPENLNSHEGLGHLSGFRWTRRVMPTSSNSIREIHVRVSWLRGDDEEAVEMSSYAFLEPNSKS